jgi:hypothetical protein
MTKFDPIELSVCVDCVQLLANGEINDGTDAAERCADGQLRVWGPELKHMTLGGEELGFSHESCNGCGNVLGGDRFRAWMMIPQ